jgi:type II secretory pathway pseudopilin PulG
MNSPHSFRYRSARPSFTVIELIVVMFLIAILAGLAMGAYFRAQAAFRRKETEDIVAKLQSQMDTQWKAVIDNAKDDAKNNSIPANVNAAAGWDSRRALIIWTKIKQRYEFPQSFDEALKWPAQTGFVQAKPSYQRAIDPNNNLNYQNFPPDPINESAALLYLNLSQSRRGAGAGFNPNELLGQHALGQITVRGQTMNIFVDTWGQPIAFIRWPTFFNAQANGNTNAAYASDVNAAPYWTRNPQGQPVDPQDPENSLYDQNWQSLPATVPTNSGILTPFQAFVVTAHPLRPNANFQNPPQQGPAANLSPIIMSSGPDKQWGLNVNPTGNTNTAPYFYPQVDFSLDPATFNFENDNIYGYRVRRMAQQGDK